jgi:ADP-ribosylation factor-like protein 5B
MGFIFSKILDSLFGPYRYKLCLIGLDNAGKTTLLYKLSLGQVVATQPTIGANVESVTYKNIEFQVWDIGGQESLRQIWNSYYTHTSAIILVVDATDRVRFPLVTYELKKLLALDTVKHAPILIFANKQDLEGAATPADLAVSLGLTTVADRSFHIEGCSATEGSGLEAGLEWLSGCLKH